MKNSFIFKFLISIFILLFCCSGLFAKESSFVSLSPALTEIMYAIGAQDNLMAVSTACTYPSEVLEKEKIGNNFFINEEKILKLKPDFILAMDSSALSLNKFKRFGITPLCFENPTIDSIHQNILELGNLTGKEVAAQKVVEYSVEKIKLANKNHKKKILYLVQTSPMISIGRKSFITDIIKKSGNISVTEDLNSFYPAISEEYAIMLKPDVIVLGLYSETKRVQKLFPKTKIIVISEEENDIINRPGARIYKSVEFFSKL